MDELSRSPETLDWLIVGDVTAAPALGDDNESREGRIAVVADWSGAVRHLVAFRQVRHVVLLNGCVVDYERAARQASAMQPGIRVIISRDVPDEFPPWIQRA